MSCIKVEVPSTPTPPPRIKSEPQSTSRVVNIPYNSVEDEFESTRRIASTPLLRVKAETPYTPTPRVKPSPQRTPKLDSSPLSPYPSSPIQEPRRTRVYQRRTYKKTRPYRQTRASMRTPAILCVTPVPSYNLKRLIRARQEIRLGVTPCPGDVGVPNGAGGRGDGRIRARRHMDREFWDTWRRQQAEEEEDEVEMEEEDEAKERESDEEAQSEALNAEAMQMLGHMMHEAVEKNRLIRLARDALSCVEDVEEMEQ